MPGLHETMMGSRLIEGTLPDIARSLSKIVDNMEKKVFTAIQIPSMPDFKPHLVISHGDAPGTWLVSGVSLKDDDVRITLFKTDFEVVAYMTAEALKKTYGA